MTTSTDVHHDELHAGTPDRVRQIALPTTARALSTLARIDYADAFRVPAGAAGDRTGEQWARATLEDAPMAVRRQLRWGWLALGLKLGGAGGEGFVLGWEVRRSGPDFALLGAGSRVGMPAELLFKPEGDTLLFATLVRLRNPVVRAVWAAVAPWHRQVVPALLGRAARSAEHRRQP